MNMLLDKTEGHLIKTLAEVEDEDASFLLKFEGSASEAGSKLMLPRLVRQLKYLDRYNTHIDPAPADHKPVCAKHKWFMLLDEKNRENYYQFYEHMPKCDCGDTRDDPRNTIVTLRKDSCDWSFSLAWSIKKKGADKFCACKYDVTRIATCECYSYWFNGGLIFFKSDRSWSVHT